MQHELFSMIEMKDLEELPTVRFIYQRIQENKVERTRSLHASENQNVAIRNYHFVESAGKIGVFIPN